MAIIYWKLHTKNKKEPVVKHRKNDRLTKHLLFKESKTKKKLKSTLILRDRKSSGDNHQT
jgi:hypothetical protein